MNMAVEVRITCTSKLTILKILRKNIGNETLCHRTFIIRKILQKSHVFEKPALVTMSDKDIVMCV